ncbi:hypothetical protein E1B28_005815 [Marasmius oreades]|uniref:Peroxin-19 n=1 Tax=Marasmius oreades TaxID=181124 RepID=A0A9P7S3Y2_9AGAR|nr:uncharacterized protein E1B28_005815 [Marasmius oreades]KAG7095021.1 hypothetical protein E1B28_005815 [Marasmius oreades]
MSEPVKKVTPSVDADEDLDELDDVLPEFNSPPTAPLPHLPQKTTLGRKRTNTRVDQPPVSIPGEPTTSTNQGQVADGDGDVLSDEFAKELEKLMKELVVAHGDEKGEASGSGDGKEDQEAQKVFKAAWEAMLIEEMNGMASGGSGEEGVDVDEDKDKGKGVTGDFQSRIKQTMNKLKESEDNLKAGSSSAPDTLDGLFNSLQDVGDDAEFNGFLEEMMNQLMSKEVLYQPLKELGENFPPYLENPPEPITAEDRERYEAQLAVIKEILATFERPGYDDKDPKASKEIADLMAELQSHGSPPEAVMGPSPMGLEGMPGNCVVG